MYVSGSLGGSTCSTSSTPLMSSPRAATSVATSTLNLPARKPASVLSRWFCALRDSSLLFSAPS